MSRKRKRQDRGQSAASPSLKTRNRSAAKRRDAAVSTPAAECVVAATGAAPAPAPGVVADAGGVAPAESGVQHDRRAYDLLRENLEALVVAIILAIIIRHFAVEAFEIPTGSMATTLYGMHARFECPNCDTEFDCGISSNSSTGEPIVRYDSIPVCDDECPDERCKLSLHFLAPGSRDRGTNIPLRSGSRVECSASGTVFTPSSSKFRTASAFTKWLRCPICHLAWQAVVEAGNRRGGDKILVNKFAYQVGKPERFDVIVFGFDQWKNYIKRLVGLPGETIQLIDGDVYVDGRIVRKSRDHADVQSRLWRKIADSDVHERGLNPAPAWFEPGAPESTGAQTRAWERLDDDRYSLNNPARREPAILQYNHDGQADDPEKHHALPEAVARGRGFDNYVAYNALLSNFPGTTGIRRPEVVGDIRLEWSVQATSGHGWIGAEIRDGAWTFQVRLPVGAASASSPATVERVANEPGPRTRNALKAPYATPQGESWQASDPTVFVPLDETTRLAFESCDDRIAVLIDGAEVLAIDYVSVPDVGSPEDSHASETSDHYVWILGSDVQANVGSMRLFQDVYYTSDLGPGTRTKTRIRLEPGQYFALGDNSPSSADGRAWGFVPEKNLMGKALLVFWPALPWHYRQKMIR